METKYKILHKVLGTENKMEVKINGKPLILTAKEVNGVLFIETDENLQSIESFNELKKNLLKVGLGKQIILHPKGMTFYTCEVSDDADTEV